MQVRDALNMLDWTRDHWFIESGTLLGAWRDGTMIAHDDDFDIALYTTDEPVRTLHRLVQELKQLLPAHLDVRPINTYVQKVEVFDPKHGNYMLRENADFHHVTVDISLYTPHFTVTDAMRSTHEVNSSSNPLKWWSWLGSTFRFPLLHS